MRERLLLALGEIYGVGGGTPIDRHSGDFDQWRLTGDFLRWYRLSDDLSQRLDAD